MFIYIFLFISSINIYPILFKITDITFELVLALPTSSVFLSVFLIVAISVLITVTISVFLTVTISVFLTVTISVFPIVAISVF